MMFVLRDISFCFYIFRIRNGKPQSTINDITGHEGQSLTGNNEDSTLKNQLQQMKDSHL